MPYDEARQVNNKEPLSASNAGLALGSFEREKSEEGYILSLKDLLEIMWRWLWVILLTAFVFAGFATGLSLLQTPHYKASITMLIGQEKSGGQSAGETPGSMKDLMPTMTTAVDSRSVAEGVIRRLNLSMAPAQLLANLSAKQIPETQFIEVSYTDSDPQRAEQVANAIGAEFSERALDMNATADAALTASVWQSAVAPQEPISPQPLRNGLMALALGGVLGVALAFLLDYLAPRWRSPEEVEQVSKVPTLAVVPEFRASSRKYTSKTPKGEHNWYA